MLFDWTIRYSVLWIILIIVYPVVHWAWSCSVELSVMVYCACYYVDSRDKFLYSCYLFMLHGIPVTQIFLLFISVICSTHVYTHAHTTEYTTFVSASCIPIIFLSYEESCAPIRPRSHMLYCSTNHLRMGRLDDCLDLIGRVSDSIVVPLQETW